MTHTEITLREIRKNYAHKGKSIVTFFPTFLSTYFIKLLLYTPLTANQISLLSFIILFVPIFMIGAGNYWISLIGTILLQIPIILDYSDGAIARISRGEKERLGGQFSKYYCWFLHDMSIPLLMFALSINAFRYFGNPYLIILGGITLFAMFLTTYSRLVKDRVIVEYMLTNKKIIVAEQSQTVLDYGINDTKLFNYGIGKDKSTFHKLTSRAIHIFLNPEHIMFLMIFLAIFNLLHYGFIFYSCIYVLMALIKVPIELRKGFSDFKFK